jgi:hypothetical protein
MHFNYVNGRWIGDMPMPGTRLKNTNGYIGARTGLLDLARLTLLPPHLHLHTHPTLPKHLAVAALMQARGNDSEEKLEHVEETAREKIEDWRECMAVPSEADVVGYAGHNGGTVGNIISCLEGHFVCIKKRASLSLSIHSDEPEITIRAVKQKYMDLRRALEAQEITQLSRDNGLKFAAAQLSTDYVSYFGEGLENPVLQRLPVPEPSSQV